MSFKYSGLPHSLQVGIAQKLGVFDSLSLLKSNQTLRNYLLNAGPLQGRISKLLYEFDNEKPIDPEAPLFSISLISPGGAVFQVLVVSKNDSWPSNHHLVPQEFAKFLEKLHLCREIEFVTLNMRDEQGEELTRIGPNIYNLLPFLPKLQHVSRLSIRVQTDSVLRLIVEQLHCDVDDNFSFKIQEEHREDVLELEFFGEMFEKQLKKCKILEFYNPLRRFYEKTTNSNAELVVAYHWSLEEVRMTLEDIVLQGIPSRNPKVKLVVIKQDTGSPESRLLNIVETIEEMVETVELEKHPGNAEIERLLDFYEEMKAMGGLVVKGLGKIDCEPEAVSNDGSDFQYSHFYRIPSKRLLLMAVMLLNHDFFFALIPE